MASPVRRELQSSRVFLSHRVNNCCYLPGRMENPTGFQLFSDWIGHQCSKRIMLMFQNYITHHISVCQML